MSVNCDRPTPLTETQKASRAAEMMQAAGIQACSTDNTTFSAKGSMNTPFASAGISISAAQTTTLGCENVVSMAQEYNNTVQNVSCIINKSITQANIRNININNIKIVATDGSEVDIDCSSIPGVSSGGFSISQSISVKDVTNLNLSTGDQTQIDNSVKSLAQKIIKDVQETKADLASSERGNKLMRDIRDNIQTVNYNVKSTDILNNLDIKRTNNNTITIKATNNSKIRIRGSQCNMDQNITVDIVSNMLVSNMIGTMFKNVSESINKLDQELVQKSEGKGIGELEKNFWTSYSMTAMGTMLIGAVIVIAVVVGLIFVVKSLASSPAANKYAEKKLGL